MAIETKDFKSAKANEAEIHKQNCNRMVQVMQLFSTMVVGRPIGVRLSDNTIAPAWSTSNTIQFSEPLLPRPLASTEGVLVSRGLVWHELSHILFTPRSQSDISVWVRQNGFHHIWNMLEDQRIEMLTVTKYQAVAPWLVATIAKYILSSDTSAVFPLVYGRKYLPASVRSKVAKAYVDQHHVAEIRSIIDEYLTLTFPSGTERAKVLIERMATLVRDLPDHGGHGCGPDNWQSGGAKSRPVPEKEQEGLVKRQPEDDEFDWSEPQPDTEPADGESDGAGDGDGESDTESDTDADGNGAGDSAGESDEPTQTNDGSSDNVPSDSDSESDTESDTESDSDESSTGNGAGAGAGDLQAELENLIDRVADHLSESIHEEVQKIKGALSLDGKSVPAPPQAPQIRQELVSVESTRAMTQFKLELRRIKADHDPAWQYKTRRGRLNVKRYSLGGRIDEVFDKFEQGRDDATDIEAVILLDTSSSMDLIRREAYEAMWSLKRALDGVEAKTTVLTFDYRSHVLYSAEERATATMRYSTTNGGTNPTEALAYAKSLLANSASAIKMLYIVTDGSWGFSDDAKKNDQTIAELTRAGVVTSLAFIEEDRRGLYAQTAVDDVDRHSCSTVARVTSPADLVTFGRAVVKQAIARNLTA